MDDVDSQQYCLTIIGPCQDDSNKFIKSVKKFYESNMDKESTECLLGYEQLLKDNEIQIIHLPYDQEYLFSIIRDSINQYVSTKDYTISFPELDQLSHALLSLTMLFGTDGKLVSKKDYENKILSWLETTLSVQLKKMHIHSDLSLSFYDINTTEFKEEFQGYHFSELPSLLSYKEKLLSEGKELIDKIKSIKLPKYNCIILSPIPTNQTELISNGISNQLYELQKAEFSDEEQKHYKELIEDFWCLEIEPSFFHVGNLKKKNCFSYLNGNSFEYEGNEFEKEKFNLILEFIYEYLMLLKSFDSLYDSIGKVLILPLCIKNSSHISDNDITIKIPSKTNDYTIFDIKKICFGKNEDFLNIYADNLIKKDIIKSIFELSANEDINDGYYQDSFSYVDPSTFSGMERKYGLEDIKNEIAFYQMEESSPGQISYDIKSIRSEEALWLNSFLMIIPNCDNFFIEYSIFSHNLGTKKTGRLKIHNF